MAEQQPPTDPQSELREITRQMRERADEATQLTEAALALSRQRLASVRVNKVSKPPRRRPDDEPRP